MKGLHFLLTYRCTHACDHCFVFGGPTARGTFSLGQIRDVLEEARRIGTITSVCFEGGEPFLYYPIMLEGVRLARQMGFNPGIVTNAYWATSSADAETWLRPLHEAGLSSLSISDDALHNGEDEDNLARNALAAAKGLGMTVSTISTTRPAVGKGPQGEAIITGGVMFRGRAAEKLVAGLPTRPCAAFGACSSEDLRHPGRVHLDVYGHVHLCQGLSMGNMWETPLATLVTRYDPDTHPICGPLLRGGPARLAEECGVEHKPEYVSACHMCYEVRRALLDRFPQYLAPRQLYGLE